MSGPNLLYSKLVREPDDFVGLVAYGLYKRDKTEFFEECRRLKSRPPSAQELEFFHLASNTASRVDAYRTRAESLLEQLIEESLEEAIDTIERDSLNLMNDELRKSRPFLRGVLENATANFVVLAVTALILVVIWSTRVGVPAVAGEIFGYELKERAPTSTHQVK